MGARMTDTLHIVRGAADSTLAARNRSRVGLLPHTEAFEKFLADQDRVNRDLKRKMIGIAVSRYRLWPKDLED